MKKSSSRCLNHKKTTLQNKEGGEKKKMKREKIVNYRVVGCHVPLKKNSREI